jgi:pimeloyl-ACP methyl ester carboxylesterase
VVAALADEVPEGIGPEVPEPVPGPPLPLGRRVELPGRGTTFVREVPGPPGAPTVVLLHGLAASGGLNWFQCFEPLGRHVRVLAVDHRGHGRGLRTRRRFRLADCADDVAALLEVEGVDRAVAVGYSMGGPISQLLWRRHPERVSGLVMCATAGRFVPGRREQMVMVTAMSLAASTTRAGQVLTWLPGNIVRGQLASPGTRTRPDSLRTWARAEMRRHDWRLVAEAAAAIGTYDASRWIGDVDVPTAVVVTTEDKAVPPTEQARLALQIPQATLHRVRDGHLACTSPTFARSLVAAVRDVARRAD